MSIHQAPFDYERIEYQEPYEDQEQRMRWRGYLLVALAVSNAGLFYAAWRAYRAWNG